MPEDDSHPSDADDKKSIAGGSVPTTDSTQSKIDLVMQLLGGRSLNDLSRETGLRRKQLNEWRNRFLEGGEAYLAGQPEALELQALRDTNRVLLAKTEELERENLRLAAKLKTAERQVVRTRDHPNCSEEYAHAFEEGITSTLYIPEWRTHVLIRNPRPGAAGGHATGVRPFASLDPECDFAGGFMRLQKEGVASMTLITDPLWSVDVRTLKEHFSSVRPFKESFFIDREASPVHLRKRHRNMINNARRACDVRWVSFEKHLDRWMELYQVNVQTRAIGQPFSRTYFERIAGLNGLTTNAVFHEDEIVTMTLWLRFNDVVYYHDGASSERGYDVAGSYVAFADAIDRFQECRYVLLGGSVDVRGNDGLAIFKRGFTNASAWNYLCSAVFKKRSDLAEGSMSDGT